MPSLVTRLMHKHDSHNSLSVGLQKGFLVWKNELMAAIGGMLTLSQQQRSNVVNERNL